MKTPQSRMNTNPEYFQYNRVSLTFQRRAEQMTEGRVRRGGTEDVAWGGGLQKYEVKCQRSIIWFWTVFSVITWRRSHRCLLVIYMRRCSSRTDTTDSVMLFMKLSLMSYRSVKVQHSIASFLFFYFYSTTTIRRKCYSEKIKIKFCVWTCHNWYFFIL